MQSLFWFLTWLLLFGGLSTSMQPPLSGESVLPNVTPSPVPSQPSADAAIFLDFGTSKIVKDGALTLTFSDVVEDSRCPADVDCVWSGMIVVRLAAAVKGQPAKMLKLGGMTDSRGVVEGPVPVRDVTNIAAVEDYTVQLLTVTPYPAQASAPAEPTEYQVSLLVQPAAEP